MGKSAFCICENKDADQLRCNCAAHQRLCFRYSDSTMPLVLKSKISGLLSSSEAAQPGLSGTWTQTPKTGSFITRLISFQTKVGPGNHINMLMLFTPLELHYIIINLVVLFCSITYTGKIDNYKQFKCLLKFALWHDFLVHFSFCLKLR